MIVAVVLWSLSGLCGGESTARADKAKEQLDGTWVVASTSWCGRDLPLTQKEKDSMTWTFAGKDFKYNRTGKGAITEAGTYRIDQGKSPKHLDLTYTKGEVLATRQCIYALAGDELKVGFTASFAPGTPEQEIEEAKRTFAIRPKSFDSRPEDLTFILVLKRRKK
jgi:uncharacterized protein (TIGR03067 family)